MIDNYILISDLFREQLLQFCSDEFITNNISWHGFHVYKIENCPLNIIEASSFIRDDNYLDSITKIQFCLAWLQSITANVQNHQCGIVFFDGIGYTSLRFTDFLCHLTNNGIITREEHMQLTNDWLDITDGMPFYQ